MRRTRAFGAVALLAGAAVVLSSCSSGSSGSGGGSNSVVNEDPTQLAVSTPFVRPKVPDAGKIAISVDETMTDYNNQVGNTSNSANAYIDYLLQPSPFWINDVNNTAKVQLDGDLMDSVKVLSQNPLTIQYNIKQAAVWQDGAPVDCSDFYLQWLSAAKTLPADLNAAFGSAVIGLDHIGSIACGSGGKQVTVNFTTPFADWQNLFTLLVPAHVLEQATGVADVTKLNPANAADHDALLKIANFYSGGTKADQPGFIGLNLQYDLSAGPYMLKSADGKATTVLVRNPKWWGNPAGPAEIDITTNTSESSGFQQLQNKEISLSYGQPDSTVAQSVAAAGAPFKVLTGSGETWEHLDVNAQNALFKKYPELQQAFFLAVNRKEIINKVVAAVDPDIKPLGNAFFVPNESSYQDDFTTTGNGDAAAAKKLLESKGWTLGPDGVYAKNGDKAEITIGHKPVDRRTKTVQVIQSDCGQAGIKIDDYSSPGFNSKDLPASNFQVALFAWTGVLWKSQLLPIFQTGGTQDYQKYTNPQVDKLLTDSTTQLDYAKRIADLQQADKLVAQDGFILPLFTLPEFVITDGSIVSTDQNGKQIQLQDNQASGAGVLWDAYAWQKASS